MAEPERVVNFARLVDWMEDRLPENEARLVEEALAGADDDTLADVAWLRRFFRATDVPSEPPPREIRDTLIDAFEAREGARRTPGFLERVFAGLSFDSKMQPAEGLRALGAQRSRRQLVFNAEGLDLVVNLLARGTDDNLDLDGQVLPHEETEPMLFSVQLLREGAERALTATDDFGSFLVEGVPPGDYELVLSADRIEISVGPLEVGL